MSDKPAPSFEREFNPRRQLSWRQRLALWLYPSIGDDFKKLQELDKQRRLKEESEYEDIYSLRQQLDDATRRLDKIASKVNTHQLAMTAARIAAVVDDAEFRSWSRRRDKDLYIYEAIQDELHHLQIGTTPPYGNKIKQRGISPEVKFEIDSIFKMLSRPFETKEDEAEFINYVTSIANMRKAMR